MGGTTKLNTYVVQSDTWGVLEQLWIFRSRARIPSSKP